MFDIYEFYVVPWWQNFFLLGSVGLFVLIVLALGAWFSWRLLNRGRFQPITPEEWARRELAKLDVAALLNKSDVKRFYYDLTRVVKWYLEKQYCWTLADKTDDELVEYLQTVQFDTTAVDDIKDLVAHALMIKFADQSALRAQAEKDLEVVYRIVTKDVDSPQTP